MEQKKRKKNLFTFVFALFVLFSFFLSNIDSDLMQSNLLCQIFPLFGLGNYNDII